MADNINDVQMDRVWCEIIFWYKEQGNSDQVFSSVGQSASLGGLPLKEMVALRGGLCESKNHGVCRGSQSPALQRQSKINMQNTPIIIMAIKRGNNLKMVYVTSCWLETLLFQLLHHPMLPFFRTYSSCSNLLLVFRGPPRSPAPSAILVLIQTPWPLILVSTALPQETYSQPPRRNTAWPRPQYRQQQQEEGSHILGSTLGKSHRQWQVKDQFQEDPEAESADLDCTWDSAAWSSVLFPEQVVRFQWESPGCQACCSSLWPSWEWMTQPGETKCVSNTWEVPA